MNFIWDDTACNSTESQEETKEGKPQKASQIQIFDIVINILNHNDAALLDWAKAKRFPHDFRSIYTEESADPTIIEITGDPQHPMAKIVGINHVISRIGPFYDSLAIGEARFFATTMQTIEKAVKQWASYDKKNVPMPKQLALRDDPAPAF